MQMRKGKCQITPKTFLWITKHKSLCMPLKSDKCKWEMANEKITNKIEINEITPKTWINSNTIYNEFF